MSRSPEPSSNGGHGRIAIRRHWLLDGVEHLEGSQLWVGLKRVGLVEAERRLPGQEPTLERHYYLLSLDGGSNALLEVFAAIGALKTSSIGFWMRLSTPIQ